MLNVNSGPCWGVGMLWRRSTSVSLAVAPSGGLRTLVVTQHPTLTYGS